MITSAKMTLFKIMIPNKQTNKQTNQKQTKKHTNKQIYFKDDFIWNYDNKQTNRYIAKANVFSL